MKVWVRGYGLVDSAKIDSEPGRTLHLSAVAAPNEAAATEYYPGVFWYSMISVPAASEFPGRGDKGNRSDFSPRTSTGGSMTRMPVGRAEDCRRRSARARCSTTKVERKTARRSTRSRFGPTPSRVEKSLNDGGAITRNRILDKLTR